MRRHHESDMGSPCRSVFTFILKQKTWSQRRLLPICREIDRILWKKIDQKFSENQHNRSQKKALFAASWVLW